MRHAGLMYRAILLTAAWLVPHGEREEWLAEWTSELWYLGRHGGSSGALRFRLGSFQDASSLRRNRADSPRKQRYWLQSPIQCLIFLASLAALTSLLALGQSLLHSPYTGREFMLGQLLVIPTALFLLQIRTNLMPAPPRLRPCIFLAVKIALLLPIVFCGTLDFGPWVAAAGFRPDATLIGYVFAFGWALRDQRRRCPVCLRLLTNPVRVGQPSHTVLDWYGTELICSKGHGLLYISETSTSSYSTHRWLHLDPSWRSLFS